MELKVILLDDTVVVQLPNGTVVQKTGLSEETKQKVLSSEDEEEIYGIMDPEYLSTKQEREKLLHLIDRVNSSRLLRFNPITRCVYWDDVSPLSLPLELVEDILDAEDKDNQHLLNSYKKFWTLMSLNPNEQCRKNLYWFLQRNGLVISSSGFFVAYRNVNTTKEKDVYTDAHTGTFRIKIGEVVTMPREECDDNSEVTCSRGLAM